MEESLFLRQDIELLDIVFQEIESDYKIVKEIIGGKNEESEILASLQSFSLKGGHDQVARGLLYGYLLGHPWTKFLLLTSRDSFKTICLTLAQVLPKLRVTTKAVDFLFILMKTESPVYPETFLYYIRTISLSKQIKTEIDSISAQPIVSMIFYKLLRQASLESESEKYEYINIISYIWKKRKDYCLAIGRDLVRLISALGEVTGIEEIWNDLFSEPGEGNYPAYLAVLATPTNPKFHSMALPPILESKLIFVIENSPHQSFSRYLKWITEGYSQSLIPDMVRFIVTYLPARETSPRWQIIAWFLNFTTDHHIQANIKQALVFDCLFFSPTDQIYTIEPALSLIKYSITKYPHIAEEILEFILTSAELYDKRSTQNIMKNLKEVMNVGFINGIFPPLDSLCKNEKIEEMLRSRLFEINEIASNEGSVSSVQETEEFYINTTRVLMDNLGEQALRYASEPTFDGFWQILMRYYVLGDSLYHFLMKCMIHEYTQHLSLEINTSHLLVIIFNEAESNQKISEFLKYIVGAESSIGVRYLVYCLRNNPSNYPKYSDKLERDLKAGMEDLSLQTLSWIFGKIFSCLSECITPSILHFFFQVATFEQIYQIELDICNGYYRVIGYNLSALLEKSCEFTATEQIFLWKLIQAEISPDNLEKILEAFQRNLGTQWEALSGLFHYLLSYISFIKTDHVKTLLSFPARSFKGIIMAILSQVSPEIIEEAITFILVKSQFQGLINLLKHLKVWVEAEGKLGDIIKNKNLQTLLSSTLHSLTSDYFTEFSKLVEPKQLFPR